MIVAQIKDAGRYYVLHPLFRKVFAYLEEHDLRQVPSGRITLEGDDLFINVSDAALKKAEEQKLEVHRRYIDIHIPLSGSETIGWSPLGSVAVNSEAPFNEAEDYALYAAPAECYFTLKPGDFCMVWPEDAHAPVIGEGSLRKLIVKVKL